MEKGLPIVWLLLRFGLGVLFAWAGLTKVTDPVGFTREVQHYAILPWPWLAAATAVYLPWVEIVCALGLLWERVRRGALVVLGALLVVFLAAITSAWARGLDITCGCFGKDSAKILTDFPQLVAQDLGLLAMVGVLLWAERQAAKRTASGV